MDSDERRLAAATALARVRADREVAFRPLCRDCRFGPVRSTDPDKCEHFAHWNIQGDPVSGNRSLSITTTTAAARNENGLCGPEGLLFAPYTRRQRVARWLARMAPDNLATVIFWAILGSLMAIGTIITAIRELFF